MSEIVTVTHTINVPKETKEVIDLVVGLIGDIIDKKDVQTIVADAVSKAVTAVDGITTVPTELKASYKMALGAYVIDTLGTKLGW